MVACEPSSFIRVNSFGPSCRIVSGRSNGSLSYMRPPGKWQGWQRDSRMGLMSRANSAAVVACAGGTAGRDARGAEDAVSAGAWAHAPQSTPIRAVRRSI